MAMCAWSTSSSFLLGSRHSILFAFVADDFVLPFSPAFEVLALLKDLVAELLLRGTPASAVVGRFEVADVGLLREFEEVRENIAAFGGGLLDLLSLDLCDRFLSERCVEPGIEF